MNQPVIIGAGAAGLTAALCLAPQPVTLLCNGLLGANAASGWAQGGIATAIGNDDSALLHTEDTLAAGAGLCDSEIVARITGAGPWVIEKLVEYGAKFERAADGAIALGLEAAHSRRRIVHAHDATGAEVMRVLINAVRAASHITVIEQASLTGLAVHDNALQAIHAETPQGSLHIKTAFAVMATGGIGGLFAQTTNPLSATGTGLALAARAGAELRDMEFVQFHPTAFASGVDPMPLISEALRGEGAILVNASGLAFMSGNDLAARDIVARTVAKQLGQSSEVFLDARNVPPEKFPAIFASCQANGIDPRTQPIPVRPAAHYHMGGIAVNADCESSIHGLFACGEVASTGLHGANRLASNSLLEAMATGRAAAEAIAGRTAPKTTTALSLQHTKHTDSHLQEIRKICTENLGISRHATPLETAIQKLAPLAGQSDAALVALLIAHAALNRQESRGAHYRTDFPQTNESAISSIINLSDISTIGLAA
jgi:L-aspartate oxidase